MTEQQLLDLKKQIDSAKQRQAELTGKKKALMEQLAELGCKSVAEADKRIAQLQKQIEKLEEEKEKGIKEIEDNYEF